MSEKPTKRVIEIAGVKVEVDLREAKAVHSYKVGDAVKLLKDTGYSSEKYKVYPGIIVGFNNFEKLPTIVIAYLDISYSDIKLQFEYFNNESEKVEMCPAEKLDISLDKAWAIDQFDREIEKKKEELSGLENKKKYFLEHFKKYFKAEVVK